MTPLPADRALDAYFLDARSRLLDLAAFLDRLDRGAGAGGLTDPRLEKIRQAVDLLRGPAGGRAEAVQKVFSLDYDPNWTRPDPR